MRRGFIFLRASDSSFPPTSTSGVDPRISRRRDLENDVSGSSKPVDEIRMIDGVSGLRVDSRLDCIIRLRIRLRLQFLMETERIRGGFVRILTLREGYSFIDNENLYRWGGKNNSLKKKKKGRRKSVYTSVAPFANSYPSSAILLSC